jgi:hypothetical protein
MKTAALTALLALGALAPWPAAATEPLVDLELSLGRTPLPVFILEASSRSGLAFEGSLSWTVNGMPWEQGSAQAPDGDLLDIRIVPLTEAALVCADLSGWIGSDGPAGAAVEARSCAIWEPWDGPLSATLTDDRLRTRAERPAPEPVRRMRLR